VPDGDLRDGEGNWVARFAAQAVSCKLGCTDWGETRRLFVEIQAFAVVKILAEIVAANLVSTLRAAMVL